MALEFILASCDTWRDSVAIKLSTCIRELLFLNLREDTGYRVWNDSWYVSFSRRKCWDNSLLPVRSFYSKSFSSFHSMPCTVAAVILEFRENSANRTELGEIAQNPTNWSAGRQQFAVRTLLYPSESVRCIKRRVVCRARGCYWHWLRTAEGRCVSYMQGHDVLHCGARPPTGSAALCGSESVLMLSSAVMFSRARGCYWHWLRTAKGRCVYRQCSSLREGAGCQRTMCLQTVQLSERGSTVMATHTLSPLIGVTAL
jgi:hypothetical protein